MVKVKGKADISTILYIVIVLLFFGSPLIGGFLGKAVDERQVDAIVTNDNKFIDPNVEGRRTIYCVTADGEDVQYQVADSLFKFRFDSDEFWGEFNRKIENYEKVEVVFTIAGCRNHVLSWYPDIFEYEIVENSDFNVLKDNQ